MTAHELAEKLLECENIEVMLYVYIGGNDEWQSIEDAVKTCDPYDGCFIELKTYKGK